MKIKTSVFVLLFGFYSLCVFGQNVVNSKPCLPCEQLKKLRLPDVTILKAESLAKDTVKSPAAIGCLRYVISVPFCKVSGRISKEIGFELLLPQTWNG